MKLKLMNAERYVCAALRTDAILKGQIVDAPDELAKQLLKETRVDGLNNEHPVWKKVRDEDTESEDDTEDDGEGGEGEEDGEGKTPAAKPPRAARTATAAKKKSG